MATLTLENLRLEVREFLGEEDSEADPMWSNTFLNKWINRFTRIVAETTECIEANTTFATVATQTAYPFPVIAVTAPEPDLILYKPTLLKYGAYKTLTPIVIRNLGNTTVSLAGEPSNYLIFDEQYHLYPVANAVETVNIWGYCYPTAMVNSTDGCGLVDELADVVIKLTLAKARQQEEEFGVANQYYSEVPFNISDYLIKNLQTQEQDAPLVVDYMNYGR